MSQSLDATSFTTRSPVRNFPSITDFSPAISLNVMLLHSSWDQPKPKTLDSEPQAIRGRPPPSHPVSVWMNDPEPRYSRKLVRQTCHETSPSFKNLWSSRIHRSQDRVNVLMGLKGARAQISGHSDTGLPPEGR